MPADEEFIPAKPTGWVRALCRVTLPVTLPRIFQLNHIDYDPADLETLKSLKGERVMLTPNHPSHADPAVLFHLSTRVEQNFSYLACVEAFEKHGGLQGWLIQRVGAYSVVRGTVDRASFRTTRETLVTPGSKLVVFPEGEVYSQNDSLMPFQSGTFQLAYWALDDLRKAGQADAPLYVLPLALKYVYTRDMRPAMLRSVESLERTMGIEPAADGGAQPLHQRVRQVGAAMLRALEREYRLPSPRGESAHPEDDLTPRLNSVKEEVLRRVSMAAGVPLPGGGGSVLERLHVLLHAVDAVTHEPPDDGTPYDRRLREYQRERSVPLLRDLDRLTNFIAIYDGYVREHPTQERMAETIIRLERECYGKERLAGPRRCRVQIGEPIDLRERYPAYQQDKRGEVAALTAAVRAAVLALLTEAQRDLGQEAAATVL
ncbi:MAG TPA: lysophospholipid acyltransferase family protein [Armatimonadaceae bacterium]|nr:lysophospholipid acyltransferase family protein [Armatimonadaceae bacterium]